MSMLDLRSSPDVANDEQPANIEAEQSLLGILLCDNDALHELETQLDAASFFEPFHGRLFTTICEEIADSGAVEPISVGEALRRDPAYRELGGRKYFLALIEHAPPAREAEHYARLIQGLAIRRSLIATARDIIRLAQAPETGETGRLTTDALIEEAERQITDLSRVDPRLSPVGAQEAADAVLADIDDVSKPVGAHCGIEPLHTQIGFLLPKEMTIMGGDSSMGKSALACSIANRVAAPAWWREVEIYHTDAFETGEAYLKSIGEGQPFGVLELSGEMTVGQLTHRHLADIGYALFGPDFPTFQAMRNRTVTAEQRGMLRHARDIFAGWPIEMLKRSGLKPSNLRSIARRVISKWARAGIRPGLLILDNLTLMRPDGKRGDRYSEQSNIVIDLAGVADDLDIHIMALAHLNRENRRRDDKRPQMGDLRDSSIIENCADAIIFPFRDAFYAQREKEPAKSDDAAWYEWDRRCSSKELEIIPGKVRAGSTSRSAKVWIDIAWNAVRSSEPPPRGRMV
jgi:replicative DNA helicase